MGTEKAERPRWLELERVLTIAEAEELTGLSRDSLTRHHREKIGELSPRRIGMKLKDALAIARGE